MVEDPLKNWKPPEIDFSDMGETRAEFDDVLTPQDEITELSPQEAYTELLDDICRLLRGSGEVDDLIAAHEIMTLRKDRVMPLSKQCETAIEKVREVFPHSVFNQISDKFNEIQIELRR